MRKTIKRLITRIPLWGIVVYIVLSTLIKIYLVYMGGSSIAHWFGRQ